MNLFHLRYSQEVEFSKNKTSQILVHQQVCFKFDKALNQYSFLDSDGDEWLYLKGHLVINFEKIGIGTYSYSDGRKLTRTSTAAEVIKKAAEYFLPFVEEIIDLKKPDINLRQDDCGFYLN